MNNAPPPPPAKPTAPSGNLPARAPRFLDLESIGWNMGLWTLIEVGLILWNKRVGDHVAKFVDVELLIAQFAASVVFFFFALAAAWREGRSSTGATISGQSASSLEFIKTETYRVPIFFGSAMLVSALFKGLEVALRMLDQSDYSHWQTNLRPPALWLAGSLGLFVFSGIVSKV